MILLKDVTMLLTDERILLTGERTLLTERMLLTDNKNTADIEKDTSCHVGLSLKWYCRRMTGCCREMKYAA
jgi:hypothetical protein